MAACLSYENTLHKARGPGLEERVLRTPALHEMQIESCLVCYRKGFLVGNRVAGLADGQCKTQTMFLISRVIPLSSAVRKRDYLS